MKKNVVIFDVDGTLVNSSIEILNLCSSIKICTGKIIDYKIISKIQHLDTNELFKMLQINYDKQKIIDDTWTLLNKKSNSIKLYKGIPECIKELHNSKQFFLSIITSRTSNELKSLKCLSEVLCYFDDIVTRDMTKKGKPNAEPLLLLEKRNKLNKEKKIYIGDQENDLIFSINANMQFLRVNWGNDITQFKQFSNIKFETVFNTCELYSIINKYFMQSY